MSATAPRGVALHSMMTLRALGRRRLTVTILVALPLALYLVSHTTPGRAARALVFGISWAVSTVAFFATVSARQLEPRLRLAGRSSAFLVASRITALVCLGTTLAALFWAVVALDGTVEALGATAIAFVATAAVAVAFGTAVGTVFSKEMEGTMVLFFFAGLQSVANPFDRYTELLPFWSSRELATYAVDGPGQGSLSHGLAHGAAVIALCALVALVGGRAGRPR